jgi:hypothetical protein
MSGYSTCISDLRNRFVCKLKAPPLASPSQHLAIWRGDLTRGRGIHGLHRNDSPTMPDSCYPWRNERGQVRPSRAAASICIVAARNLPSILRDTPP